MTQENKVGTKRVKRRAPINGARNVLTVQGKEPGFAYRIVNDEGDRISMMQERGYEIVTDSSIKIGDRRVATPSQQGSAVRMSVGKGIEGVLMRIPQEFYDEDQESKQQQVNELEAQMKREAKGSADYGKVEISISK